MSETEIEQDQVEVHWQHPRHELERPALLVCPNPLREQWAAEIDDKKNAVVVCRMVLWETSDGEIEKHAEPVDPLDEVPGYVHEALMDYDSEYGPVEDVINPVASEDDEVPENPRETLEAYFTAQEGEP